MTNTIVEQRSVERDYGIPGTECIVDTDQGRILIADAFGGIDSPDGGTVRWEHGSAYALQPGDTFAHLDAGGDYSRLDLVLLQQDDSRPWLGWGGKTVEQFAQSIGVAPLPTGRPPKSDKGKASAHLQVRVTPADKAAWTEAAGDSGLSDWVISTLNAAARE